MNSVWSGIVFGSTSTRSSKLEQLGTPFVEGFTSIDFNAYTSSQEVSLLRVKPAYVKKVAYSIGSQTYGNGIIAYSELNNLRQVYFGYIKIN